SSFLRPPLRPVRTVLRRLVTKEYPTGKFAGDLTASERSATFGEHTFVIPRRRRSAHRTAAGDLGLPRRLRRPARLPADGAGDRGRGRACVSFDSPCPPCESRAGRAAETRSDEASCPRALRPRPSRAREGGRT